MGIFPACFAPLAFSFSFCFCLEGIEGARSRWKMGLFMKPVRGASFCLNSLSPCSFGAFLFGREIKKRGRPFFEGEGVRKKNVRPREC